jgi:hypothetical protein
MKPAMLKQAATCPAQEDTMLDEAYSPNAHPAGHTYTVEEAFDKIDAKFIAFYGEYGRQLVNQRRTEWNQEGPWNFELFDAS